MTDAALAIHVCADTVTAEPHRQWPWIESIEDTLRRAQSVCQHVGVVEQQVLAGPEATTAGLLEALQRARSALSGGGLLVLTFAGHTERGNGPIERARWCLFDGGLELARVARELAQFSADVRIVVITDTCYASAIASTLVGAQQILVLASCGEEQTTTIRMRSEFMARLEAFICSRSTQSSLEELLGHLEHDTPDCERPCVWTNTASWWSAVPLRRERV